MRLSEFLMPARCPGCGGAILEESWGSCFNCHKKLEASTIGVQQKCKLCFNSLAFQKEQKCQSGLRFCQGRQLFFDRHLSLYQLNKSWNGFLRGWKFEGNRWLHKVFLARLRKEAQRLAFWQIERVGYIDSGSKKQDIRPYQPCHDLAVFLAELWGVPWGRDLRKRKRLQQSKKSYANRFFDIHDSFEVRSCFPEPPPKHYLLLEDVFTTGATANEAARMLKARGVRRVFVLSMLKAGKS